MFCLLANPKVYFFRHVNFLDRVTNISRCEVGSLSSWREISLGLRDWVSWWNRWSLWFSKVWSRSSNTWELVRNAKLSLYNHWIRNSEGGPLKSVFQQVLPWILMLAKVWNTLMKGIWHHHRGPGTRRKEALLSPLPSPYSLNPANLYCILTFTEGPGRDTPSLTSVKQKI